jgi:hypothetical protein
MDHCPVVTVGANGNGQLSHNAYHYCGASSNGPLMLECPSLLWALPATVHVPHVQQQQQSANVRVSVTTVGTSNNYVCATYSIVAMVH